MKVRVFSQEINDEDGGLFAEKETGCVNCRNGKRKFLGHEAAKALLLVWTPWAHQSSINFRFAELRRKGQRTVQQNIEV